MSEQQKPQAQPQQQQQPTPPQAQKPPVQESKPQSVKERIDEQLPPKLMEAMKAAGFECGVLAVKSDEAQGLWRVVTSSGHKHEFSFEGAWLTRPRPVVKPVVAPVKK